MTDDFKTTLTLSMPLHVVTALKSRCFPNYTLSRKDDVMFRACFKPHLSHGHAECPETRKMLEPDFDSHIRIKVMAL